MENSFPLKNCANNDVLSFKSAICKVAKLRQALQDAFRFSVAKVLYDSLKSHGVEIDNGGRVVGDSFCRYNHRWFDEGVDCEILKIGAENWQKGKVKIKVMLEFCPDDPSPEIDEKITEIQEIRGIPQDKQGEIEWSIEEIYRIINQETQR